MKKTGIIIFFVGLLLTIFTTVSFFTREDIVKIGDLKITANKPHNFRWSPLIGVAVMAVGGVFIWRGIKK
jgi:hypothetical protein